MKMIINQFYITMDNKVLLPFPSSIHYKLKGKKKKKYIGTPSFDHGDNNSAIVNISEAVDDQLFHDQYYTT